VTGSGSTTPSRVTLEAPRLGEKRGSTHATIGTILRRLDQKTSAEEAGSMQQL
jgi:hypothetical protein